MSFWDKKDIFELMNNSVYGKTINARFNRKKAKEVFQELYHTFIEKPCSKRLQNIDFLHELPFYIELNIEKISKAFKRYARNYKIEIIDSKDYLAQLEASNPSLKDLFKDLLDGIKSFKHQITVKFVLKNTKKMET